MTGSLFARCEDQLSLQELPKHEANLAHYAQFCYGIEAVCEVLKFDLHQLQSVQRTASKRHSVNRKPNKARSKISAKRQKSFHVPFEEFSVPDLGDLLQDLERVKPDHWTVVVSDSEEAQHIDCMKPLAFINVHPPEEDSSTQAMGVIYQYCASCKTAVRVL